MIIPVNSLGDALSLLICTSISLTLLPTVVLTDRSLMAKKADGIKESTDSNATIEEEETRGYNYDS